MPRHSVLILALPALASLSAGISQEHSGKLEVSEKESFIEFNIGAHGNLVRREALMAAGLAEGGEGHEDPADIKQDGIVTVVSPAQTASERMKLEELTEECMQDEPTAECMEKFGSYGVRKLFTEDWDNVKKLKYRRPGWMSHPEVQKKRFFNLTLPGTVSSGTYAIKTGEATAGATDSPYGLVSQNFDFYQQLELGIRMFDIRVSYSTENSLVYISHGALMIPLATALRDIRRFLEEHEREVIVLDLRKDEKADASHLKALKEEETTNTRVPGQLVHEAVQCELKEMLATYKVLNRLPANEVPENPTIGGLTDLGANVIYFWETQQVLCTSFQDCTQTPGWFPPDKRGGMPLAFGPPFLLGKRINANAKAEGRIIEPACHAHSTAFTKDDQPERMLKKIKTFAKDMASKSLESRPKCFPAGAALPKVHTPTLWYTVDGYVTSTPEEQAVQADRMRGVKAIYTRGEGFTVKTDAERTNYLLLSWFLKRNNQELFTKPNAVMFEFAGAAMMPILRIIEAQQARPECGWAVYCKASGSCWADTLLGAEDACLPEDQVLKALQDHANGKKDNTAWIIYVTIGICSVLSLCCISTTIVYIHKLMKPSKPKDVDEALITNPSADVDAQSSPPANEIASDAGDRPEEKVS